MLNALGPVSFDIYLPAWPAMAADFGCTTGALALSLSSFMVGLAVGQLCYGPLSDCYGRRPFIAIGGALYFLASLGCVFVTRLEWFVLLRLLEGFGACAGVVMTRAMIRDVYSTDEAAKCFSQLMCSAMLVTLLSPLLGAWLLRTCGWQALFVVLSVAGLSMILVAFLSPETWPAEQRHRWSVAMLAGAYRQVVTHRQFLGYALTGASIFAGLFTYLSSAPYVLLELNKVPPEHFGYYFGVNLIAQALMFLVNSRLVVRWGAERTLRFGLGSALGSGLAAVVGAHLGNGWYEGIGLAVLWFLSSITFIIGNALAAGMRYFPTLAGTAAALAGVLQSAAAALIGGSIGLLQTGTVWPLAWGLAGSVLVAAGCYHCIARSAEPRYLLAAHSDPRTETADR